MNAPKHRRSVSWPAVLVVASVLAVAGVLVSYGAAGSYESLSQLAARNQVPFPRFFPVGVDGALVGFLVLDIALTLWGRQVAALHWVVRLFGAVSIVFNFRAGWPDTFGAGARVMAPALLIITAEVVRFVVLREQRRGRSVPARRWLLAPRETFSIWRRMQLWDVRDYATAIDLEISRREALAKLGQKYGERWEARVPAGVAWCLSQGVRMRETLAEVERLCAPPAVASPSLAVTPATARGSASRKRPAGARAETIDSELRALAEYQKNRPLYDSGEMNGTGMAAALGLSKSRGRALLLKVKRLAESPDTGPIPVVTERAQ